MPSVPKLDLHDPAYLKWWQDRCRMHRAQCFATGEVDATVVPHHVRTKRRFGDKWNIVPLSFRPHQLWHQQPHKFVERYGITREDMMVEAERIYDLYITTIATNSTAATSQPK